MFIDTHCHLNIIAPKQPEQLLEQSHFASIDEAFVQAAEQRVQMIINVGTSIAESLNSITIAKRYQSVFATVGIHPCDSRDFDGTVHDAHRELKKMVQHKEENKIVGIGETGLDYYHKPFDADRQKDFFKMQIELALEHKLALVVHVREAADDLLRVLEEYVPNKIRGVIHCFSQKKYVADLVVDWGLYVGLDAPIGYPKNEEMRTVFKNIPLAHIVLETDAPFLPPQQYRGKPNRPAYLPMIAQYLADIQGVSIEEVELITTQNAKALFKLA
jgi:TatD DNase family protein